MPRPASMLASWSCGRAAVLYFEVRHWPAGLGLTIQVAVRS